MKTNKEIIPIDSISSNHTSQCVTTIETVTSDLLAQYKKATTNEDKIEIARAIKGCYDTSIAATQVTINALMAVTKVAEVKIKYNIQ